MRDEDFEESLRGYATESFLVVDVRPLPGTHVELQFVTREESKVWAVVLPLPSAPSHKPWLYTPPDNAADSVRMLGTFLDEEILTTAIHSARRIDLDGATFVELAPYGLRRADDEEDARLAKSAIEGGWDGQEGSSSSPL